MRGMSGMSGGADQLKPMGSIEGSALRLNDALTRLEALPSAIKTSLNAVLSPEAEVDKTPTERSTYDVPLAETIQSFADRVGSVADQLFAIRDRVEL